MSPFLAILAFQATVIEPAKDPALVKPITVRVPIAALREVVGALAKASGQPLDVTANISDLKATVLVKDFPTGRTMEALADVMGLIWKKDGAYYRLSRAEGSAAAEKEYVVAERTQRQSSTPRVAEVQEVGVATLPGQFNGAAGARPGRGRRGPGGGAAMKASYLRFDPNLLSYEGAGGRPPTRLEPPTVSGASEFAKAVLVWPSVSKDLDPAWGKQFSAAPLGASTWENGAYVLGELLASWHDATGLPVVADAFRLPAKANAVRSGTALNALESIVASERLSLRLADGVARLRNPAFWRLREQEVSESAWNSLERGKPGIDDFATFASRLTVAQAASFRSLESPMSHVRTIAVREAYPALLLWTALPSAARRALLAGTPVGIASAKNATNAYLFALREAPYYNAGDPTPELAMAAADLGMFGKSTPGNFEIRLAGERGGGVSYLIGLP